MNEQMDHAHHNELVSGCALELELGVSSIVVRYGILLTGPVFCSSVCAVYLGPEIISSLLSLITLLASRSIEFGRRSL